MRFVNKQPCNLTNVHRSCWQTIPVCCLAPQPQTPWPHSAVCHQLWCHPGVESCAATSDSVDGFSWLSLYTVPQTQDKHLLFHPLGAIQLWDQQMVSRGILTFTNRVNYIGINKVHFPYGGWLLFYGHGLCPQLTCVFRDRRTNKESDRQAAVS